jgi:hypothetical protein
MAKETEINDDALADLFQKYRDDPVFWAEHILGVYTWGKMREVLYSIRDNKRTAVKAAHGVSKTFTAAVAACWFYNVFPESKVITTAPIFPQVDKLLWGEIRNFYQSNKFLIGDCLKVEVKDRDHAKHEMLGFSTDDPARAEGFHAPHLLYIFDEAKGVEEWMFDSAMGAMNAGDPRWLIISTTDGVEIGSKYQQAFLPDSPWHKISISAYDTPELTGEKFQGLDFNFNRIEKSYKDLGAQISGKGYIEDGERDWGVNSVMFKTKVLGEIVSEGANTAVSYADVKQMFANHEDENFNDDGKVFIGADLARFGIDRTVFYKRKGLKIIDKKTISNQDLVTITEELKKFADFDKSTLINVDETGLGAGVADMLKADNYNVKGINFGSKAKDPDSYNNSSSEMWFEASSKIKNCSCQFDRDLEQELINRQWKLDLKGRRCIESKDDYKKRGFNSPDMADALLLCLYESCNSSFNIRTI